MKAIVIDQYGGKEQLKEREMERPSITDDQVLLEVHATSIIQLIGNFVKVTCKKCFHLNFRLS